VARTPRIDQFAEPAFEALNMEMNQNNSTLQTKGGWGGAEFQQVVI